MRQMIFLTIAYLIGIQGFIIFAPYLLLFTGSVHLIRVRANRSRE